VRAAVLTGKRARSLRRTLTPPEAALWKFLRVRDERSPAFRRQHPIGPYILDFYCAAASLAVEVDGYSHGVEGAEAHDIRRDAWLRSHGLEVVRIAAVSVMSDPPAVADGLRTLARQRAEGRQ